MDTSFERMQQQAQQRVAEMQKKAKAYTKEETGAPQEKPPPKPSPPHGGRGRRSELLNFLNFKNISLDSDRSLILGIIFLLANESDDEWLILALIYIML